MRATHTFASSRAALAAALVVLAACTSAPARLSVEPVAAWLDVPGGRIYYEAAGVGPAVVLIHGGFGDRRMWDDQFDVLARDFRVVRYDHRGFGRSTRPTDPYDATDDLRLLLDHLDIERAHLVGNSLGSSVAIQFALANPSRVDRLVLIAGGAEGYPVPPAEMERFQAVMRAVETEGLPAALELWLAHPMLAVARADTAVFPRVRQMVIENGEIWRMPMEHWPTGRSSRPTAERLSEIRAPTLVIVGERDTQLVRDIAAQTAAGIANARFVVLADTDHLLQMERPVELNRLVVGFLIGSR